MIAYGFSPYMSRSKPAAACIAAPRYTLIRDFFAWSDEFLCGLCASAVYILAFWSWLCRAVIRKSEY
jgi:hypothetical protein